MVGTHALIEPPVEFRDLAVVVVDEQHRFGVRQRAALDAKAPEGLVPHALHMTATPIPRTLSLTAYGDLDATVLRELPQGAGRSRRSWSTARAPAPEPTSASARRSERGASASSSARSSRSPRRSRRKAATAEFERLRTTEFPTCAWS